MRDLGLVSNCWRMQLEEGASLDTLLSEADARGFRHVELRQGCLGAYESMRDEEAWPDGNRLRALPDRFPRLAFNVALALPYLGAGIRPDTPLFEAGLVAALAVAGAGVAHLRLVDAKTPAEAVTPSREAALAAGLAALAMACADRGAILSVENARQPWEALRRILTRARGELGDRAGALGLCYDPCNLLSAADRPDPATETPRLSAAEIALFHLKQTRSGTPLPDLATGDIDWPRQLAALEQIGYTGPRLFEIPPGPEIWDALERSRSAAGG
jgi:sugar phosphate isomerase/epimerase